MTQDNQPACSKEVVTQGQTQEGTQAAGLQDGVWLPPGLGKGRADPPGPGGAWPRPEVAGGFGHPGCWEPLLLPCGVHVQGLHSLPPLPSPCLRLHWLTDGFGLCPLPLRDKVLLLVSSEQLHEVGRAYVTYVR